MYVWHTAAEYMKCTARFSSSNREGCFIY